MLWVEDAIVVTKHNSSALCRQTERTQRAFPKAADPVGSSLRHARQILHKFFAAVHSYFARSGSKSSGCDEIVVDAFTAACKNVGVGPGFRRFLRIGRG